jgi:hypothetical protein
MNWPSTKNKIIYAINLPFWSESMSSPKEPKESSEEAVFYIPRRDKE